MKKITPFNRTAHEHLTAQGYKYKRDTGYTNPKTGYKTDPKHHSDNYRCSKYGISIYRNGKTCIWLDDYHLRHKPTAQPWWPPTLQSITQKRKQP